MMTQRSKLTAASRPSGSRSFGERHAPALFLAPAVLYLALLSVFPLIFSLSQSVTNRKLGNDSTGQLIGFDNYLALLRDPLFQKAVLNTFSVTLWSVLLELLIGFFIARLFVSLSGSRLVEVLRAVFILPMMLTPVVSGLLWSFILNPTLGIVDYLLSALHLPIGAWFSGSKTAMLTLVLVNVWQWGPFLMLIIMSGLLSIPKELYEAAELDGAHWYHLIRYIELPFLQGVLFIGLILRIVDNFRLFDVVYAATKGGPSDATEVVSMYAYRQMFNYSEIGAGSATAVIILILASVLVALAARVLLRGERHAVA